MENHPYELLAELLDYPAAPFSSAEECRTALAPRSREAASLVESFGVFAASADPRELEELFVRTFDFEPSHCLDLGNQLFGESYKRGAFLVKVQRAVREHGVAHPGKLADHLTVVLRLLPRLPPQEAHGLVDEAVLPVLAKVLSAFEESHPYRMLLQAVMATLQADYGIQEIRPVPEELRMEVPGVSTPLGPPLLANRHEEEGSLR